MTSDIHRRRYAPGPDHLPRPDLFDPSVVGGRMAEAEAGRRNNGKGSRALRVFRQGWEHCAA
ncbi:MAG TPA: hypothetical protein VIG69_08475 [Candidatus Methylomirabilis sp.]